MELLNNFGVIMVSLINSLKVPSKGAVTTVLVVGKDTEKAVERLSNSERVKFECLVTDNFRDALHSMKRKIVDVVVMCCSGTKEKNVDSCFKFIETLSEYFFKVPVVVMNVPDDPDLRELANQAGVADYIIEGNESTIDWSCVYAIGLSSLSKDREVGTVGMMLDELVSLKTDLISLKKERVVSIKGLRSDLMAYSHK